MPKYKVKYKVMELLDDAFDTYAEEKVKEAVKDTITNHNEWIVEVDSWAGSIPIVLLLSLTNDIEEVANDNPEHIAKIILGVIEKHISRTTEMNAGVIIKFSPYDLSGLTREQMLTYLEAIKTNVAAKLLSGTTNGQ